MTTITMTRPDLDVDRPFAFIDQLRQALGIAGGVTMLNVEWKVGCGVCRVDYERFIKDDQGDLKCVAGNIQKERCFFYFEGWPKSIHETKGGELMKLKSAIGLGNKLIKQLEPYCSAIQVAGSVRRQKAEPGDIEIILVRKSKDILGFKIAIEELKPFVKGRDAVGDREHANADHSQQIDRLHGLLDGLPNAEPGTVHGR